MNMSLTLYNGSGYEMPEDLTWQKRTRGEICYRLPGIACPLVASPPVSYLVSLSTANLTQETQDFQGAAKKKK